jgi:hypothetical protein
MTPEDVKAIAETVALGCAAVFFIYKFVSGYLYVDMSLSIALDRSRKDVSTDWIVVTATIKKGSRGSVRIHDAQARVSYDGRTQLMQFVGFHRLSYATEMLGKMERKRVDWTRLSKSAPLLRLPPNEETEFSCYAEIPGDAICTVEATILGRERSWFGIGQWRASRVSVPKPQPPPPPDRDKL